MLFACKGGMEKLSGADPEPLHLNSAGALLTSVGNRSDLHHSRLCEGFHFLFISSCCWAAEEDLIYKFTNLLPEHGRENKFSNHTGSESIQW